MKVLIVGAGPTGLVMAHELARHGVQCRIIDKASGRSITSRAIGIHARTMEVFDIMGIAPEFVSAGHPLRALSAFSEHRLIAHIPVDGLDTPYPFVLSLPQNDTEEILEEHVARRNVVVERNTEITALDQGEGGVSVRLRLAGTEIEAAAFDYVIGCDGAHSTVRQLLGLPFTGGSYTEVVLLADIRVEGNLNRNEGQMFLAPNGLTLFLPLPDNRYRLIATGPLPQWGVEPTLEQCQSLIDSRGLSELRLTDPAWTSTFHIHHRKVSRFRQGRVFLAGDAAHVHSPMGAQGMNAGIQDAFNLAWKIDLAVRHSASPHLLDTYEEERMPIDTRIIRATDQGTRLLFLKGKTAHFLHREVIAFLTRFNWIRRRIIENASQIAANYRQSPIVEEHGLSEGPQAGDRAPDACIVDVGGAPVRLFDLFGGGHTLLLLWPRGLGFTHPTGMMEMANTPVYTIASPGSATADFIDVNGSVATHYGIEPAAYWVRPDGYVAFRCALNEVQSLLPRYIEKIFAIADRDYDRGLSDSAA